MLGYILAAAAAFGGYELYKKAALKLGPSKGFTMTPGHVMYITYMGGVPKMPPTQAQAQAALNASSPGMYNVVQTQESAIPGTFEVSAVFEGPAAMQESAASLTTGWSKPNSIVVQSVQDMGSSPQTGAS